MDNTYKAYEWSENDAYRAGREAACDKTQHIGAFNAYRDAVAAGKFQASTSAAEAFLMGWNSV